MAHQLVLVLIKDPHANVVEQVEATIGRHSHNARVKPYKQYFKPCYWDGRLWEEEDAPEFVRRRESEIGEVFGRDEKGYYQWLDTNPNAHFDWYTIGGGWDGIFAGVYEGQNSEADGTGGTVEGNICPLGALPQDFEPASIVTPEGEWHFFGWRFGGEPLDEQGSRVLNEVLTKFKNCFAVAVDVHS